MTHAAIVSSKELARIEKTAKRGKSWSDKVSAHRATVAPTLEANFNASCDAVIAAQPQWVKVEDVDVMRSPGSSFVAIPVSGRKNSRLWDIINLNDLSDIVCQLTSKEVCGWLTRKAISEANA